jgi:hypothetical protein
MALFGVQEDYTEIHHDDYLWEFKWVWKAEEGGFLAKTLEWEHVVIV